MSIQGKKKEFQDNSKVTGVFEANVIAVNPTMEELNALLGSDIDKELEYVKEKEVTLKNEEKLIVDSSRIAFYLQDVKTKRIFNVSYFLENRDKEESEKGNIQYINEVGATTWAADEDALSDEKYAWFTKREYRRAKVGEAELYEFVKAWLKLDYRDPGTVLDLKFDNLITGDVRVLRNEIGKNAESSLAGTVTALAIVTQKEVDGETKFYQNVSNKFILGGWAMKTFRTKKFTPEVIEAIKAKKKKDLKAIDKFVLGVTDSEYPIKGAYSLGELTDFNPEEHLVTSDEVIKYDDDANDY
jgi:hypothetical protein